MKLSWPNPSPVSILIGIFLIGVIVLFSALGWWLNRGDWIYPDQPQVIGHLAQPLSGPSTIGQTFVAYQAGLTAIEVKLTASTPSSDLPVTLHLRQDTQAEADLHQVSLTTSTLTGQEWIRFAFNPIPTSRLKYYYFFLQAPTAKASDSLTISHGPAEAYLDGVLHIDGQPQEAQLAFRLVYHRPTMAWQMGLDILAALPKTLAILLLLTLPGGALLSLLWPKTEVDWLGWVIIAIGISLALFPLWLLLSRIFNQPLTSLRVWGTLILFGVVIIWPRTKVSLSRIRHHIDQHKAQRQPLSWDIYLSYSLLTLIISLVVIVRLLIIRDIVVPFWGDSVHHTIIAQLIIDHGGLFDSWLPYSQYQTFTMHYGFHSLAAFLIWLLDGEVVSLTILAGQLFNIIAVLALYPLAFQLTGSHWAGLIAVLSAGLLSPMPMYYVNWGRYPQLAGQAILPIALSLVIMTLSSRKVGLRWILATLVTAGLFLTYYRMPLLFFSFLGIWLIGYLTREAQIKTLLHTGLRLISMGILGLILLWPWWLNIQQGQLTRMLPTSDTLKQTGAFLNTYWVEAIIWRDTISYAGLVPVVGAVVALLWGLGRRQWTAILVGIWTLSIASFPLFPFLAKHFDIIIAIYIPSALLTAWLGGEIVRGLQKLPFRQLWLASFSLCLLIVALWGGWQSLWLLKRNHQMVFISDLQAMRWIEQNTPPEAQFFVDGFTVYEDTSIVGADAGWWLPLLARRNNTMPPQYAILNEAEITPGYSLGLLSLILNLRQSGITTQQHLTQLKEQGVTHIYLGQAQGKVNNPNPIINPHLLKALPQVDLIYQQDKIWIFALAETSP